MIGEKEVEAYRRDGFIVVPDVLDGPALSRIRQVVAEVTAGASEVTAHNEVYDLEPGHTPASPRVRRIKQPHKVHPLFDEIVRSPRVLDICKALIGPGLRLYGSKLNMKSARYGSPVEWHQDWAFYPHTNDDILAIGVMLDDTDLSNGAMLVTPGSHTGPIWNHHRDGRFVGMIDPAEIEDEIARAVPCVGRAGAMSFHHVRALHGSALNTSDRQRNLLLYEVAASDAWPLIKAPTDFEEFDRRLLEGGSVIEPRMTSVPVRVPFPPPLRSGSIYETQSVSTTTYFERAA
jgi:ectoine hydroxylase-related dioxygenase (phytanoyl-CoA dioxygenase family)